MADRTNLPQSFDLELFCDKYGSPEFEEHAVSDGWIVHYRDHVSILHTIAVLHEEERRETASQRHHYRNLMQAALDWLPVVGDGACRPPDIDELEESLRCAISVIDRGHK